MNRTPNRSVPRARQLPAIICLHGSGTSSTILSIQSQKLRHQLRDTFSFIFAQASIPSDPGPGVLPTFEGADPFFRWFGAGRTDATQRRQEAAAIETAVREVLAQEAASPHPREVVGLLGFSQGALAATWLLLQQQQGKLPWFPVRFAILVCADCEMLDEGEYGRVEEHCRIAMPTCHLHGAQDPWLSKSRALIERYYDQACVLKLEFDGAHHFPAVADDVRKAVALVSRVAEDSTTRAVKEIKVDVLETVHELAPVCISP